MGAGTSVARQRLMLEAREERLLLRMKKSLDLLILDELGYVPASKAGSELLFDVISAAYERCSVIVTTNLPFGRFWQCETHGSRAGSPDALLSHPGGDGRKLSPENDQKENQTEGSRMIA